VPQPSRCCSQGPLALDAANSGRASELPLGVDLNDCQAVGEWPVFAYSGRLESMLALASPPWVAVSFTRHRCGCLVRALIDFRQQKVLAQLRGSSRRRSGDKRRRLRRLLVMFAAAAAIFNPPNGACPSAA
jgi:hypothetical protein